MVNKKQALENITKTICAAAELYKKNLVGKTFMYVFDNRYIEVLYKTENFKHMTGVESPLSAKRFYTLAVKNQLNVAQIRLTARHPYSLCVRKLQHITDLINVTSSESFMLEEITTETEIYKFGTTDTKFTLCLGKDLDKETHLPKNDLFVVHSLRDEDCFSKAKSIFDVTHIFCKQNDQKLYTDALFVDQACPYALPEKVILQLHPDLQSKLQSNI